jgi:phospholipase/carboxylesterase
MKLPKATGLAQVSHSGTALEEAQAAVILVHGRGASAQSMLPLAAEWVVPGVAFLAPQAPGFAWYPTTFLAPVVQNEPDLSHSLELLANLAEQVETAGIPAERLVWVGFSQGASLSLEFIARHAHRYGGAAGLSGGLIGPPGTVFQYPGSLSGTPVFLGCSDIDPHVPRHRVLETEQTLQALGATVTRRLYPGMGHTINEDEIEFVRGLVRGIAS